MPTTTTIGIAGATGYAGQELIRLGARHPGIRIGAAMASGTSGSARSLPALSSASWAVQALPRPTGSESHCVLSFPLLFTGAQIAFTRFPDFSCFRSLVGSHGFRMLVRDYVGLSKDIEQRSPTLVTLVALHAPRALCRLPTYQAVHRRRCVGIMIFSCTHLHSSAPAACCTSLMHFAARD